ncbi:hypothetical protein BD410DRAFT_786206 [Rickenella mellea]|uniref:Phytase-like domain-containing protein n=1 Tax=Rickenella mellea TaxID=50990 RepID=A0A4Y7QAI0_9AGAM|nr:hypothetical protein BD410DRAFT_786206 [Rickenella mellea]
MFSYLIHNVILLLSLNIFSAVRASPCVAMDIDFNLLVFGLDGKDYNAGPQNSWTSSTPATDISTSGRPPFDGSTTSCYLSQFDNAIYALSADSSKPTAVYIYDATAKSWSTQSVDNSVGFDPSNFVAILDHDTDVFYALSKGELFSLDMKDLKSAQSSSLPWNDVGKTGFSTANYEPVMALAQNHIHFLDVSGLSAGQAFIFVIHFSFFQPTAQSYPSQSGSDFPLQHGQTASFFQKQGVQQEFAFIPDDGSTTYVVNVETNSTQALPGPATKDPNARYFAGITSLVQLDSQGNVAFLPYTQGDVSANSKATWSKVTSLPTGKTTGGIAGSPNGTSTSVSGTGTPKNSGSTTGAASQATGSGANGSSSGAMGRATSVSIAVVLGMAVVVALL